MKKTYEEKLKDKEETRTVKAGKAKVEIAYKHQPNVVGPRSKYTGLPIWVGKTEANANGITVVAFCWLNEPYTYDRGRIVTTGRLMKELGLPTSLAEQVKD